MGRLTPEQDKSFRKDALANMNQWEHPKFFADKHPLSRVAITTRLNKLKQEFPDWRKRVAGAEVAEVTETLQVKLEKDVETLRRVAASELKKAIDAGDRKGMLAWWDRFMLNAKVRGDLGKSLNILIDARDQSTNIDARGTVARELFDDPDLCGDCRLRLLAKHAKDVTQ